MPVVIADELQALCGEPIRSVVVYSEGRPHSMPNAGWLWLVKGDVDAPRVVLSLQKPPSVRPCMLSTDLLVSTTGNTAQQQKWLAQTNCGCTLPGAVVRSGPYHRVCVALSHGFTEPAG